MSDRRTMSVKEISSLATQILVICTLLAGVGKVFVMAKTIEDNKHDIDVLKPTVEAHTTQNAVIQDRLQGIQKSVDSINFKLDRWNRRRQPNGD